MKRAIVTTHLRRLRADLGRERRRARDTSLSPKARALAEWCAARIEERIAVAKAAPRAALIVEAADDLCRRTDEFIADLRREKARESRSARPVDRESREG